MINRVHEGQHSNTVVLVTCLLTSVIQDQESLGLYCAAIKDVKDLSDIASDKTFSTLCDNCELIKDL